MNALKKYVNYSLAYAKYGDIESLIDSYRFMIRKKGAMRNRIMNSYLGKVKVRKGTNDFQYANYYYEWGVKSYLLKIYKDFDVFIDIGAGIGDYSLMLAKNGLRCIAFEPLANNFNSMIENFKMNQLNKLIVSYNHALGSQEEEAEFIMKAVNTGASHRKGLNVNQTIDDLYVETVQIKALDQIYQEFKLGHDDNILIKMDMEGMETDGLKGARQFIQSFPRITIILEAKHSWDKNIFETLDSIANFDIGQVDDLNIYAKKISNHK
jgi:FkbM family methyltransferase